MPSQAAPTYAELFALYKAEAGGLRPDLLFRGGDVTEALAAGSAAMGAAVAAYAAERYRATTTAGEGEDLADLAEDHWRIAKAPASKATGQITLQRTAANGAPAGAMIALTRVATAPDASGRRQVFTIDTIQAWGLGELGPRVVNATALEGGQAGNVGAGAIVAFPTAPFDPAFTVTNSAPFAGGNPGQDDESLREEIRAFPTAIRRATLDACEFHARQVAGVAQARAVEEKVGGVETGIVLLYIADSLGQASAPLLAAVRAAAPTFKPAGSILTVLGGSPIVQPIEVVLTLAAGLPATTTAALRSLVQAAIVAAVNRLGPNDTLYRGAIRSAAVAVDPVAIKEAEVVVPAFNVAPAAGQVIRIQLGDVTVT